ncbi:uncharacterized protein METZ01_LOCUS451463, partial [marine metagenome]
MDTNEEQQVSRKRLIGRILAFAATFVVFASLLWLLWGNLRQNVWVYYTDDA